MANLNKVIIIGNLTRGVELKQLPSGSAVANLGLAINESFTNKSGERQETTTFVEVEVWGAQAENCSKYLSKGRQVLVEGRLKLDQWQDQEGNNRSRLLVSASNVTFLDSRRETDSFESGAASPSAHETKSPASQRMVDRDVPPEWDEEPPF